MLIYFFFLTYFLITCKFFTHSPLSLWGYLIYNRRATLYRGKIDFFCNCTYSAIGGWIWTHKLMTELWLFKHFLSLDTVAFWRISGMNKWEILTMAGLNVGVVTALCEVFYRSKCVTRLTEWLMLICCLCQQKHSIT